MRWLVLILALAAPAAHAQALSTERIDFEEWRQVRAKGPGPVSGIVCRFRAVPQLQLLSYDRWQAGRWTDDKPEVLAGSGTVRLMFIIDRKDANAEPSVATPSFQYRSPGGKFTATRARMTLDDSAGGFDLAGNPVFVDRLNAREYESGWAFLRAKSATVEFFDASNKSLGRFRWDLSLLQPGIALMQQVDWRCTASDPR